jgi:hypothetical protein
MSDLMQVASGDGIKLQGFVEIELISTKDNVRRTYKNTITKGGKQYILDKSVGRMLEMAADAFGMPVCSNVLAKVGTNSNYPVSGGQNFQNRAITNVLLNLGSEATGLSETSTYINVFESTLTTASKVIGYANNIVLNADGKKENNATSCISLKPGEVRVFKQKMLVRKPHLWSPESPYLYRMETRVKDGSTMQV